MIPNRDELQQLGNRGVAEVSFWIASKLFDRNERSNCPEYVELALEIYPPLRHTPQWLRFQAKRAIGYNAWALMRPFVRRLRRGAVTRENRAASITDNHIYMDVVEDSTGKAVFQLLEFGAQYVL